MALTFTAGQLVTANELNLLVPVFVQKPSAQVVTNSIALVNDNDIVMTLLANQTVQVDLNLQYTGSSTTAMGLRLAWATTGTLTLLARFVMGPSDLATVNPPDALTSVQMRPLAAFNTNNLYGTGTAANTYYCRENLTLTTGVSGGVLTLQFAQFTLNAGSITLNQASSACARYVL